MAKTLIALVVCLSFAAPVPAAAPVQPKTDASPQVKPAKPAWSELKPAQQQVLAPLQEQWQELDTPRRKKWIKVADSFPKMKPAEQERLQTRMKDWAKLTPEQRRVARKISEDQKDASRETRANQSAVAAISAVVGGEA